MCAFNLGFGKRNLSFEDHWEELDIESYIPKGAVLLCFGGNQTTTSEKATRVCATAERFVGLKLGEEQSSYKYVDLLGFYYTTQIPNTNAYTLTDEQRKLIANNIFLKRCFAQDGSLLPSDKVIKSFSLINVLTHCWGALELSHIGKMVENGMIKLGYSAQDIQTAFNQIRHISYAPYTNQSFFPFVRINSFMDSEFKDLAKIYKQNYGKQLNGIDIVYDQPGYFMNQQYFFSNVPIVSVFSSQLINTPENSDKSSILDEHTFILLERNYDWTQGHQQQGAKNADLVSKISSYVLADAIAISIQNSMTDELIPKTSLEDVTQIAKSFAEEYSEEDLKQSY